MKQWCRVFWILLCCVLAGGSCLAGTNVSSMGKNSIVDRGDAVERALAQSQQCLVVTSADWRRERGQVNIFGRPSLTSAWRRVAGPFDVVLGRAGMGWGVGHHGVGRPQGFSGPVKREGDLRAPAGVFDLSKVFGVSQIPGITMPFIKTSRDLVCVDDARSRFYNRIVREIPPKDWGSRENMLRRDNQYRLGVVVEHNTPPARPGMGSCVFLHIAPPSGRGTAGCTAMTQTHLQEIVAWLDPGLHPLLIQLPESVYKAFLSTRKNAPPI